MNRLNNRKDRRDEILSEQEDRTIGITQLNERKQTEKRKMSKAPETCRTIKDLTFMSVKPQKEREKRVSLKNYSKK